MPSIQNSSGVLNWLGGIGSSDKGDQVSLNHTAKALVELAGFLINEATRNLQKGGNVASGKTAESMQIVNLQTNATKISLDIEILSSYKFLDQGVRGTESGTGKFAFKSKYPNKKMAAALLLWIKKRRIVTKYKPYSSAQDNLKGKNFGSVERKNQRIKAISDAAASQKSLAYAMATNIKKRGIKPTRFFSKAVEATKKEQKKRFADAFRLDIIETLSKN